ncbi:hypothetical protein EYF80_036059 [Liparis tanakae]|uniref:Uncharacterized protein n=1 Tax=Liparis tanakae TaxID=230148 RepID=A0A4Z2GKF4_9TELE|nr:hypothetical protein EYF80_036059 [Liparis tanakae]
MEAEPALLVAAAPLRRRPPARSGRRPCPSPSPRPAARVLLVRRLLRLSGPIPTVTSTATPVRLLLPGGDKQSLHVRNMRQRRRRNMRRRKKKEEDEEEEEEEEEETRSTTQGRDSFNAPRVEEKGGEV